MRYHKNEIPKFFSEKPAFISPKSGKGLILFKEKQTPSQIFSRRSRESQKSKKKISDTVFVLILKEKKKKIVTNFKRGDK